MTFLTINNSIWGHSNRGLISCSISPQCIIQFCLPIFSACIDYLLKNILNFSIVYLSLPICMRMICQTHNMSDSAPTREFCKQLVCKMASLITYNSSRGSKYTQDIPLNKPHHCIGIIYGVSYGFHPFGYIIHN